MGEIEKLRSTDPKKKKKAIDKICKTWTSDQRSPDQISRKIGDILVTIKRYLLWKPRLDEWLKSDKRDEQSRSGTTLGSDQSKQRDGLSSTEEIPQAIQKITEQVDRVASALEAMNRKPVSASGVTQAGKQCTLM